MLKTVCVSATVSSKHDVVQDTAMKSFARADSGSASSRALHQSVCCITRMFLVAGNMQMLAAHMHTKPKQ